MSGRRSQYWSRSLPLTSALLPADTNELDAPSPRPPASPKHGHPGTQLDQNPTRPVGAGRSRAKVAFSRTEGWALTTPMPLGPTSRIP